MMMYRTLLVMASVVGLFVLGACTAPGDGPVGSVTGIAIDQGPQTLAVGDAFALMATVQSSGSADTSVIWMSDDASVASVDASGVVTAEGMGVAKVMATSVVNATVSASVDVTVVESVLRPSEDFTVGLVPFSGAADVAAHLDTLTDGLENTLDRPVTFAVYASFAGLVSDVVAGNVEVAFLGPTAVVTAIDDGEAAPVLIAVRRGAISYRSEFYAQCGSEYASLETLGGARFGFVAEGSTSGYQVPYVTLAALGIDPDTDMTSSFAGSHDAVVLGIYNDDLDAGVTFEGGVSTIEGSYPDVEDVVCSIGFSPDIPNDGVVVRGGVAPGERATIAAALTTMLDTPANGAALADLTGSGQYAPAPEGIYDIIREVSETFF